MQQSSLQGLLTYFNEINSSNRKKIDNELLEEVIQVSKENAQESKKLCDELLAETIAVEQQVAALKKKIQEIHAVGAGSSYLNAPLVHYEKCVPSIDVNGMMKLIESDVEII